MSGNSERWDFEGGRAQADVNAFLAVTVGLLLVLILELIWGAQWRWLATTALVGVVVAGTVPISGIMSRRSAIPGPLLSPPVDPDAPVLPVTALRAPIPAPEAVAVRREWQPGDLAPKDEFFGMRRPGPPPYSPVTPPGDMPTQQFPRDPDGTAW